MKIINSIKVMKDKIDSKESNKDLSKTSNLNLKKSLYAIRNGTEIKLSEILENENLEIISDINLVSNIIINRTAGYKLLNLLVKELKCELLSLEVNEDEFILDIKIEENISEIDLKKYLKKINDIVFEERLLPKEVVLISKINIIEITSISGLTLDFKANRIKGFGAKNSQDLQKIKEILQEKKERDHRLIGKELEIFMIDENYGKGFPIWLPNGIILKNKIRDFIFEQEEKYNYIQVETPALGSLSFYKTSGHYDHYKNSMFPIMKIADGEEFILRPMACPHHCLIYNAKPRSYRDLPFKIAEQVKQYRFESSGSLLGLERVRAMELTDSHIFLKMDQLEKQLEEVFELITNTLDKFQIKIKYLELALHDKNDKEKYHGEEEVWLKSEGVLRNFLNKIGVKYVEKIGEAAFYGPKIDIQIETALKHIITVSTIQLDFFLPEKFDLNYIDQNNVLQRVIMIHRGLIGTYERFISVLLEQTKGNLPMWLAPRQAVIIPVNIKMHTEYSEEIFKYLKQNKVRVLTDFENQTMGYKIRKYQKEKVKIQLIIGDEEIQNQTISYRLYGEENKQKTISREKILDLFV